MVPPVTVSKVLGLKASNLTNHSLQQITLKGLKKQTLSRVANMLGISESSAIALLPISRATVDRLGKKQQPFDLSTSEHIVFLSKVITVGLDVIGNEENFQLWLKTPCRALANEKPLDSLNSIFGCEAVISILYRAAYGVYS
ncbi:MAG: putative toxin-antitoxin system antitoxin component (TIGR02293 family) [Candidatus Omnitrophota bacterium]|jgi:putative toxin-antitoxin system antitoxin component (TIGR02293 family)